jgi:hypothetical protein
MAGDVSKEALGSNGGETPRNLRPLGRISDDDLAKAFEMALGFLFPVAYRRVRAARHWR